MLQVETKNELEDWRNEIDNIDKNILELVGKRLGVVKQIKFWKSVNGKTVVDVIREKDLLTERLKWGVELGLDPLLILEIFESIIRNSRD